MPDRMLAVFLALMFTMPFVLWRQVIRVGGCVGVIMFDFVGILVLCYAIGGDAFVRWLNSR